MNFYRFVTLFLTVLLMGCKTNNFQADAYGNFEAIEVIVSAESQGRILQFDALEGERLKKDIPVIIVDTIQLALKKKQLLTAMHTIRSKVQTLDAQIGVSEVQLNNLQREEARVEKLYEGGAATAKQRDDIRGQTDLLKAQIKAVESQKSALFAERKSLEVQIEQVEDQINRSRVKSPINGILLTKIKEAGEIAVPGQPLFKVANLDSLYLRAYISGDQLSEVTTGQKLTVRYDSPSGLEETQGVVGWISSQAEFTPKIIQTKEERIHMVYAIKVLVPNPGELKIGMPGEVVF
jgi:HlyD family secretion protein